MRKHSSKRPPGEILGLFDVCTALHVGPVLAENLLRTGALKGERVGILGIKVWKIRPEDLQAFIAAGALPLATSFDDFHRRLEARRKATEESRKLLDVHIDWNGQGDDER